MNRKALRHWFEEKMNVKYEEDDEGFLLYTSTLREDDLGEISACHGVVTICQSGDAFKVIEP